MKMRKALCLILVAAFILGNLISCNATTDDPEQVTPETVISDTDTAAETKIEPDLPDVSFNGTEVHTITRWIDAVQYYNHELDTESENGEAINDAVFRRNMLVEEQFDVVITTQSEQYPKDVISQCVISGDDTYNFAAESFMNSVELIQKSNLQGLQDIPYIDLSKPWWNDGAMDDISIFGQKYIGLSDICLNDKQRTYIMLMDLELLDRYNMTAPYDLVREGKWTLDVLHTMSSSASIDLNGDGVMDSTDQFGFCSEKASSYALFFAAGGRLTEFDDEGEPVLVAYSEKNLSVLDAIIKLVGDKNIAGIAEDHKTADGNTYWRLGIDCMSEHRVLFVLGVVSWVQEIIKNSETSPGVLPVPKYEESQSDYITFGQQAHSNGIIVPTVITGEKLEITGIVLEAMSAYSREYVRPEYLTTSVKTRYAVDQDSVEMLDIIFDSIVYDLGLIYNWNNMLDLFIVNAYNGTFASAYSSKEQAIIKEMNATLDTFRS